MDPFTISALILLGERVASLSMRWYGHDKLKEAERLTLSATERHSVVRAEYENQIRKTALAVNELERQRVKSARRVLNRTIHVATKLADRRSPFDKAGGWFGGRSFADVRRFVEFCKSSDELLPSSNNLSAGSGVALALAQGVGLLETTLPDLNDFDLHDIVTSIPVSGSDGVADALGVLGDVGAGELLGALGVILSGAALMKASEEAAAIRAKAKEIGESVSKMHDASNKLANVQKRSDEVRETLRTMDYQQFKLAWVSEQLMKRYRRERGLPAQHRLILDEFANNAKLYWKAISEFPLLTPPVVAHGR